MSGNNLTIALFLIGTAIAVAMAAMSIAGWKRPVLIWSLFGFAGILAVLGFGWPAFKTLSLAATATINDIATSSISWFVVFMFTVATFALHPLTWGADRAPARWGLSTPPDPPSDPTHD
jgi:hypothetical protein